jgi:hypothetical protein
MWLNGALVTGGASHPLRQSWSCRDPRSVGGITIAVRQETGGGRL